MKRFFTILAAMLLTGTAMAQLNGDGYYRVKNVVTERYIRIVDNNVPNVDITTTDIDLTSLESLKPFSKVISDPSTIIYIQFAQERTKWEKQYILRGQGSDTYQLTGYYLSIAESAATPGAYYAFGSASGVTKYLNDERGDYSEGFLGTNDRTTREWYVIPVTDADDQCFALTPEFSIGDDYYLSFYASFPILLADDMTAYIVKQYKQGGAADGAELVALTSKSIPSETPVIIKVASNDPLKNKVTILNAEPAAVTTANLLRGQYFSPSQTNHQGQQRYNAATMRVLGKTADGKLGLVTADNKYLVKGAWEDDNYYLPSNKAYVVVASTSNSEAALLSGTEYSDFVTEVTGIHSAKNTPNQQPATYTLQGVRLADGQPLAPGVYIVNGKKVVVK